MLRKEIEVSFTPGEKIITHDEATANLLRRKGFIVRQIGNIPNTTIPQFECFAREKPAK